MLPSAFRCSADQLAGHPSWEANTNLALNPGRAGRTGYGRYWWATQSFAYWNLGGGGPGTANPAKAATYWLPNAYNTEVNEYAAQPTPDIDLYPVYGDATGGIWIGPGPNLPTNSPWYGNDQDSIAYLNPAMALPNGVTVQGVCEAGCYMPDQKIQMGEKSVSILDAETNHASTLTTLTPDATIDSLKFMNNQVGRYTVDIAPANQTIFTLTMKSGGTLRVTNEHPLVTGEGIMKQAQELVVGEELVRGSGQHDPIVSITKASEFTKAYNLRPTTTDLATNVLVAQGYLSGSVAYQNEYLKYLNRVLFRTQVPTSIVARRAPRTAKAPTGTASK